MAKDKPVAEPEEMPGKAVGPDVDKTFPTYEFDEVPAAEPAPPKEG